MNKKKATGYTVKLLIENTRTATMNGAAFSVPAEVACVSWRQAQKRAQAWVARGPEFQAHMIPVFGPIAQEYRL